MRWSAIGVAAALSAGCTVVLDPSGFVGAFDAGDALDAGARDAGAGDGGGLDGSTDAGPRDGGGVDGGGGDAGGRDAGVAVDAGSLSPDELLSPTSRIAVFRDETRTRNHVLAWFRVATEAERCEVLDAEASCVLFRCAGTMTPTANAGTLRAEHEGGEVVSADRGPFVYQAVRSGVDPPVDGEVVISGTGGDVAAFSVTVPRGASPPEPLPRSVPRDSFPTLTWDPGIAADEVELHLSVSGAPPTLLRCRAPTMAGRLAVPPRLFSALPTDSSLLASLSFYRRREVDLGGPVELRVGGQVSRDGIARE